MKHIEKGGALLTALFIMTLVAIVATAMSVRLQTDIYRTRMNTTHNKMILASQALTFWAINELNNKDKIYNKLLDNGFVAIYPKEMENLDNPIIVKGGFYDLQGFFNLNVLVDKKANDSFVPLLNIIIPGSNKDSKLLKDLNNWLNAYDPSTSASNDYYLKQIPPYYPSHQLMQSFSEFRLLPDVNAEQYQASIPYLTILPEAKTAINLNTASKQVLMTLGNGLTEDKVNEFISARKDGFKNINEVTPLLTKYNVANDEVTLESSYFLSVANVSTDEFQLSVYTLIKRTKDNNNKITINVIRESFNGF